MNLMFRKNFSTEKTVSSVGGGGKAKGALGAGRNAKRRDRERYSCMEEHHYRTHLFFSAPRASTQYNDGSGKSGSKDHSSNSECVCSVTADVSLFTTGILLNGK